MAGIFLLIIIQSANILLHFHGAKFRRIKEGLLGSFFIFEKIIYEMEKKDCVGKNTGQEDDGHRSEKRKNDSYKKRAGSEFVSI